MTKRVTQAKSDPTMLVLLAAIGIIGPARHPALRRRARAPNGKSSTRDCPGTPDDTSFSGTACSQAASAQNGPAQSDGRLKAGIECRESQKSD